VSSTEAGQTHFANSGPQPISRRIDFPTSVKHAWEILLASQAPPKQCAEMTTIKIHAIATASLTVALTCSAQPDATNTKGSNAPYNEGPVWTVTMIKTKAGLADDYLKQITGTVKPVYDEEKKQKVILDYKILNGEASGPQDFNILILVEYPNWAAFDNLRDKMDPIVEKVMGTEDQRRATAVKRLDVREILGTKTMREITLK
jgi:hypothetical protein